MPEIRMFRSTAQPEYFIVKAEHPQDTMIHVSTSWEETLEVARDWVRQTIDGEHYKVQIVRPSLL